MNSTGLYSILRLVHVLVITAMTILCISSGLGYITGAGVAAITGDWHWALRVRNLSLTVMQLNAD